MKIQRVVQLIGLLAAFLLVIAVVAWVVSKLDTWIGLLVLAAVTLAAQLTVAVLRKRVAKGTVIEVDLDGGVVEKPGTDPVSRAVNRRAVVVRDVVDTLDRGGDDPRIVGLVARVGNGGIDLAHAQELRDAVHRFRASGKKTVAFAEAFGEGGRAIVDYYLAAAFEEIHLQPGSMASVEGMVARGTFLRGLFDNIGVVPDFDHRREYKAAKYMFTETGFTEPHREALGEIAADRFDQVVAGIAADRDLSPDQVRRSIDTAPVDAGSALAAGLVDVLGHRDEAYRAAGLDEKERLLFLDQYLKKAGRPHRKGRRIALIYGTGSINRGGSRFDPLGGRPSLGADDVAKAFRAACDDDKVKAIVFRVDSPGGSAVASQVVGREVERARAQGKPVVVSMGNVAGSGGYWISAKADKIVAQPGTITGSIGVVWGKLASRAAWARLGITFDEILLGRNATFSSSQDVYSASERERRTALIDDIYVEFKDRVASGRELTLEQVEQVARGRIWSGAKALELGLVDALGGVETALRLAKDMAGIEESSPVQLVVYPRQRQLPIPSSDQSSKPIQLMAAWLGDTLDSARDETVLQMRMPSGRYL